VIPLNQAVEAAKKRADVVAAKGNAATLGSLLAAEKAQLDQAFAAISTPDDRLVFGQVAVGLGGLAEDPAIQRRGIQAMLESGKANPADVPRLQFFAGSLAYQARDYGAARTALQAAITSGYRDNDAEALLAEAYMADNQAAQGLNILMQAIEARRATGTPAPENWYRRGLGAAYKAKLLDQVANFSLGLVQAYPSTANWGGAITIVREIGRFPPRRKRWI
jgi:tetratricopeptide (TPR) repeat protein